MASEKVPEEIPARKSYFFGRGYRAVANTIIDAWKENFGFVRYCAGKIGDAWGGGKIVFFLTLILNLFAILSVLVFGSIVTLCMSLIHAAAVLAVMTMIYICFSIIWLADRAYLLRKRIFTACHECKGRSLMPDYFCPQCGVRHPRLTPGVYGILHRKCTGKDGRPCGYPVPTTFFNGRRRLTAKCPYCKTRLWDRESVPICIPVVGGRSVGKTAFITAFSKDFIDKVAPARFWDIEFYNDEKRYIYSEIVRDYLAGTTRMTGRPQDRGRTSAVSFSFFVKGAPFSPERLVHVYDIAGEVFTDNDENEVQKQYEYCHGIVFMIDPFSIPGVRYRCEQRLTQEDRDGIGMADVGIVIDSFLNKLREVTGLSDQRMLSVPLAVVIGKVDAAGLDGEIGDGAVRQRMASDPGAFPDYYDTQDYLCRKFLRDNGQESFLNNVGLKFRENRFFACSAIGHASGHGEYRPQGVLAPMQWLFGRADPKMAGAWNDVTFSKRVPKIGEE